MVEYKELKFLTFNEFARMCDMYSEGISDEEQSSGYHILKKMILEKITPHSIEEINRWKNNPTFEEMFSDVDIRYMTWCHPKLRDEMLLPYWQQIIERVERLKPGDEKRGAASIQDTGLFDFKHE